MRRLLGKAGQQGRARDVSAFAAGEGRAWPATGFRRGLRARRRGGRLAAALYSPAWWTLAAPPGARAPFPGAPSARARLKSAGSAAGPSHGRLAETLSARTAPAPAAPLPRRLVGNGTYTDAQIRGDGASARALGRGDDVRTSPQRRRSRKMAAFEMPPPARGRLVATRAAASAASSTSGDDADDVENADGEQRPNLLEQIWLRLAKPLRDFGFGRTNIWEGASASSCSAG